MFQASLFLRAKPHGSLSGLEATEVSRFLRAKLDWASPKSLTTTRSSWELLLPTNTKEAFRLMSLLFTSNRIKTLFTGNKLRGSAHASTTRC